VRVKAQDIEPGDFLAGSRVHQVSTGFSIVFIHTEDGRRHEYQRDRVLTARSADNP
jgi:hypothetical protein